MHNYVNKVCKGDRKFGDDVLITPPTICTATTLPSFYASKIDNTCRQLFISEFCLNLTACTKPLVLYANRFFILFLFGFNNTPFSVMIAVTKSTGVTSNAGLRTSTPFAAH